MLSWRVSSWQSLDTPGWGDFLDEFVTRFLPNDTLSHIMYVVSSPPLLRNMSFNSYETNKLAFLWKHVCVFKLMADRGSCFSAYFLFDEVLTLALIEFLLLKSPAANSICPLWCEKISCGCSDNTSVHICGLQWFYHLKLELFLLMAVVNHITFWNYNKIACSKRYF